MQRSELLRWLREADERRLESLWARADTVRREHVGDAVHLRGLIEISNHCVRRCAYCGLRAENTRLQRYRMTADEVVACARQAAELGYGTVVLQAGEDPALTADWVADLVRRIKAVALNRPPFQVATGDSLRRGGVGGGSRRPPFDGDRTDAMITGELAGTGQPPGGRASRRTAARQEPRPPMSHERECPPRRRAPLASGENEAGLAVTLSLGEQDEATLRAWRDAGADRYLLRFETSNRTLFDRIHPPRPGRRSDRLALLRVLRDLDYEVGSGIMIGIPGQTYDDLADDIELFRDLDLDMIGVGPWLPHPDTPLGAGIDGVGVEGMREQGRDVPTELPPLPSRLPPATRCGEEGLGEGRDSHPHPTSPWKGEAWQVLNTELMTYKVVALARLVCPRANIPSTTALATLNRDSGRELGLQRGANVVMPNLTPPAYRRLYEIYPAKACLYEEPGRFHADLVRRIHALGRTVGTGAGISPNWQLRMNVKGARAGCFRPGRDGQR